MTGGMSALTILALTKGELAVYLKELLLTPVSMSLVTSGGFAFNDYFDRKPDSLVKPQRPIPSGQVSPNQALIFSLVLYVAGILLSSTLNPICVIIVSIDVVLVSVYSLYLKRVSGFFGNSLIGLLIMTTFFYGEAALFREISFASISLSLVAIGTIGGDILRDVMSLEGDLKVGYPTLPAKIGVSLSAKIGGTFFLISAILSITPYLIGIIGLGYLIILLWDALVAWSFVSLMRNQTVQNISKNERMITMAMILLPLALIAGALT
jgi:geranylgeranylglycerol-phosphate geranylgeranyltransferase